MAIIGKRMRTSEEEIIEINYTQQGVGRTLPKPILSEAGIQTILTMLGERNPAARAALPQQFVDGRFVRELDASGYVDALYRKTRKLNENPFAGAGFRALSSHCKALADDRRALARQTTAKYFKYRSPLE